ncbi:hypothetical protein RDWZM_000833 [Blomia tropicalis]|uniref:Uncharacterized protein n=1 Tax=Blomia tropicalis TaxID=40697 RepID=A0A9Q0M9M2_BLOTA|nr:hypothetical protein RDWZM_000833 [Blomia tropicalis]
MIRRSSSSSTSKRGPKTKTTSTSTTNTTTTVISSINAKNQQIGKSTLSTMVSKNGKRHVRIVKTSSSMSKCNLLEKEMSRTSKDMVNSIGKQTACTAKINDTERAKVIDSVCQFRVKLLDTIKKHIVPKRQEKQQQQSTMMMVKQNESILNQKTIG